MPDPSLKRSPSVSKMKNVVLNDAKARAVVIAYTPVRNLKSDTATKLRI
jgi:hypothetical protein